jgi:hypothetical protein
MPDPNLPEKMQKYFNVTTVDEMWAKLLTKGNIRWRRFRPIYGRLPTNPRCANCHRLFAGVGGALVHRFQGVEKSNKNPRYCSAATPHYMHIREGLRLS